jgi:outer membrane lipoprotein-sorting protein
MIQKRFLCSSLVAVLVIASPAAAQDAAEIVRKSIDNWRGLSSYGEMTMTIHRPSWERTMSMRSWTSGSKKSLVRVTAPKKDAGNGTLMVDNNMWSYAPKVNRVIKVPSSMMGQSWMGSDFSNKDVSRADDIVDQYDHTLLDQEEHEGHEVFVIEAIPHEEAAVVWGKEVLRIRDDFVLLSQDFYDQDRVRRRDLRQHLHPLQPPEPERVVDEQHHLPPRLEKPLETQAPHLADGRCDGLFEHPTGLHDFAPDRDVRNDDQQHAPGTDRSPPSAGPRLQGRPQDSAGGSEHPTAR